MKLLDILREVRRHLEENGRVSLRMLRREYELDDEALDELIEELVDVQRVARREENVLVWAAQPKPETAARAPVTDRPGEQADARKIVTILFADLAGSTALHERLDPESVRHFMERYYAAMRAAVDAHGGTVVKLLGDGVMAAFGVPTLAEDDALRAVRAGVGMQQAFRRVAGEQSARVGDVGLRVAINTGEVVVNADNSDVVGDPVNVAARLQQEARTGDVVLGESTHRLVGALVTLTPLGSVALKGRAEAVKAYRVESLERPTVAGAAVFVGRDAELARLTAIRDAAVSAPAARLAVLLGSPGLGKSRLIDELARRADDTATVITAHCDAAGGATFAPLAAALREWLAAGPADGTDGDDASAALAAVLAESPERSRIAGGIAALLAGSPAAPEETFFVVRRFLAALAQAKPVVLVIDDLHWAEPLLLDLVEHLVQWGGGVPLFILVGARPELRELRSSLVTAGGLVADVLTLSGLDASAAMRLAANEIGAADLPAAVAAKVLATSEGNPLFVRELVRMLVDEGAIERQGERWIVGANLAALEMPPTIHALLAARIERLRPEERTVLERAAIVGRHFSRSAVAALLSRNGSELDARLEALRRSELIESDSGWFLGEPMLRFHHVLIRDAAYRRLLKGTRAELHARFAEWVAARAGEADHDETIGWHLEQAHQLLRELGPLDDAGRALGEQAARRLAAAGRRALGRDDLSVAADLLGRAIDRLDAADATRADLALDWCEALLSAGDVGRAARAIDELGRFVEDKGVGGYGVTRLGPGSDSPVTPSPLIPNPLRFRAWHTCFTGQLTALTAPEKLQATADAVAAAADELAKLGDAAGEAKAHSVRAQALARLGKVGACEAALDQALAAARKAGDRRRANAVLAGAPLAALWGPSPVTRASGRCLDVVRVLRITQGAPAVEAVALSCQAVLEALRGRTDAARRMLASSRKMVEDLGISQRLFEVDFFAGRIALLEGDAAGAERLLRPAYEGLRDLGLGIDAARAGALLARALLAQERIDEAEALSHESERLAGDDLQAAIAWRGVRAEALAKRGEHAAAVELARAAVDIASATDALLDHADARLALAAALRAAGRAGEADDEKRRATELWESKGTTLLAERVQRAETRTAPMPLAPAPRVDSTGVEPQHPVHRRVRVNAAAENSTRIAAALTAADIEAVEPLIAASVHILHHPTGSAYGRAELMESFRRGRRESKGIAIRRDALATLGESLALSRQLISIHSVEGEGLSVGAAELEHVFLEEVDAEGRRNRLEIFAPDHLGDAIARLYARYAELLPEGPERQRAALTARAVAYSLTDCVVADASVLFDPSYADVDHRSVGYGTLSTDQAAKLVGSQRGLADGLRFRVEDVLALRPDGLVRRTTTSGAWRDGGGAFERTVCILSTFAPDGRAARQETFDSDREAEALARFDALIANNKAPRPARRRVRANAATAMQARFDAALAARDFDAIAAVFHVDHQEIDHPTGSSYGRDAAIASLQRLFRSRDPHYEVEPLATLGEFLLLVRRRSGAAGTASARYDVGAYENEAIQLFEVDASGLCRRAEVFAGTHLVDAIVRLYGRYAEIAADARAVVAACSLEKMFAFGDRNQPANPFSPTVEWVDHRLAGVGRLRGDRAVLAAVGAFLDLVENSRWRGDDVLACSTDALLTRSTNLGTDRASGGSFERTILSLVAFDTDGLIKRWESFDADRDAEALARFDQITGAQAPVRRRVRANAATSGLERFRAVLAARDGAALAEVFDASLRTVHHATRATYGRREMLSTWRSIMQADRMDFRSEILASLGDSLALERHFLAIEGLREAHVAGFGRSEFDELALIEADDCGRWVHCEIFAGDRLRSAIIRLFERWAEILPEGDTRIHASGTARALAAFDGPLDADRIAPVHAPSFECVDHRTLGTWSAKGRNEWHTHWRGQADLVTAWMLRDDDVLALEPAAMVLRQSFAGTRVASGGGAFENAVISVFTLDADGLITRTEVFEPDQEAEALARFDALVANAAPTQPALRHVRPNTATRQAEREWAAIVARDETALLAAHSATVEVLHHPSGATYGVPEVLALFRGLWRGKNVRMAQEILATLGDSLALVRRSFAHDGLDAKLGSIGPVEGDYVVVLEVDEGKQASRSEVFAGERLGNAVERLYERYAASMPDGPARARAATTARSLATLGGAVDPDGWAAAMAPGIEQVDHRTLSTWTARGRATVLNHLRSLQAVASDSTLSLDDVLAASPDAFLHRGTHVGTDLRSGGRYERVYLALNVFGADGLVERIEFFDADRGPQALARFDELCNSPAPAAPTEPFANAASRSVELLGRRWAARDWAGVVAILSPALRFDDRRRMMRLEIGYEDFVAQFRMLFDQPKSRWHEPLLATRGERLALTRTLFDAEVPGGGGPLAFDDHLSLTEVGPDGRWIASVTFDLDDVDAAYAELDARFEAGEGTLYAGPRASEYARAIARRDWDAVAAMCAPTFVEHDHRAVAVLGTRQGGEAWAQTERALVELAPDTLVRFDHFRGAPRGALSHLTFHGSQEGSRFELPFVTVSEMDANGKFARNDLYDPEQIDLALARFAELAGGSQAAPESEAFANAATRLNDHFTRAWAARDWNSIETLHAPGLHLDDRRRLLQMEGPAATNLAYLRVLFDVPESAWEITPIATRGERLALSRYLFHGNAGEGAGPLAIDYLGLDEVDGESRFLKVVLFDPDDLDAAFAELDARFAELTAPPDPPHPFANAATASAAPVIRCMIAQDWEGFRQLFAEDFHMSDRRRVVQLELDRDQYVAFTREVADGRTIHNRWELVATRGDRLAVTRAFYEFTDADVGPSEIAFLILMEVDDRGRIVANVRWDLDDLDAAYAELDARYEVGEAAAHDRAWTAYRTLLGAVAARDWDALTALLAPDFVMEDHRQLGWGATLGDPTTFVRSQRALFDLAPDCGYGANHVRTALRAALAELVELGTRAGGPFENRFLWLGEIDEDGRYRRFDLYDLEQLDAAQARFHDLAASAVSEGSSARFEELRSTSLLGLRRTRPDPPSAELRGMSPLRVPPNAAAAAMDRWQTAYESEDWDAMRALGTPGFKIDDRRRQALISYDADIAIADWRRVRAADVRPARHLLGTAGDRIAIERLLWTGGTPDARYEVEFVWVIEVDEEGRFTASVAFDADDARVAQREAWGRWAATDPAAGRVTAVYGAVLDAANDRDLARYRALFSDALVVEDHRHGIRIDGLDAYAEQVALLWPHAPDSRIDGGWFWPAFARHGAVTVTRRSGALADQFLWLFIIEHDRIARIEVFPLDAVDAALARLAALRPDPLRIPPNAAAKAHGRLVAHAEAGEWYALPALCAPIAFEDRRRLFRTKGGYADFVTNTRFIFEAGMRPVPTLLATAGDRLLLQRVLWSAGEAGQISEVETLEIFEIDDRGRITAAIGFDPDDRAAAHTELFERYVAGGADSASAPVLEGVRAWNDHDLERLRAVLPDDFYLDDRRRTGVGRIEGAAAYLDSLAALWELSRDLRIDALYYERIAAHGRLYVCRWSGTNAEGGDFDAVYVCLGLSRGDRPVGLEIFELDDFDAARARFVELGAATT